MFEVPRPEKAPRRIDRAKIRILMAKDAFDGVQRRKVAKNPPDTESINLHQFDRGIRDRFLKKPMIQYLHIASTRSDEEVNHSHPRMACGMVTVRI
ncbi:hypothetical protein [Bradyrhizobium sp. CCBAU 53380]|uniref:hypothetical protein n=1 Tax=Bradyrhizobium sp. CCBAU 53380 TaxID=1325117 RepID=UPI002304B0C9|nr:hypothetical protein [Bradyrhizobium sp. CCBAU 53380]